MEESFDSILMLTDAEGNDVPMELMDVITLGEESYAVLLPAVEGDEAPEAVILQMRPSGEPGNFEFQGIDDVAILDRVYELFRERFGEEIDFIDDPEG